MKIQKTVKKVVKENSLYIIGVILLTAKALLLNALLGMQIGKETYFITAFIPLIIMLPTLGKQSKGAYWYFTIIYFFITFLLYSNYIYYQYSTNFLSLYQIENLKYAETIGASLGNLIEVKSFLWFWLDNFIAAFVCVFVFIRKKNKIRNSKVQQTQLTVIPKHAGRVFYLFLLILANLILWNHKIEPTYLYYTYNKTLMVQHISIYYYHIEDAKEYIKEWLFQEKVEEDKLKQAYQTNQNSKQLTNQYEAIAQGKNVILVQLESLNEFIIGKQIKGKEITPNLNRFFDQSIYCTNMYNQGLGTTADSEHTIATSLYPLENGRVFQKYFHNTWNDLYSILEQNGYYTSFMHPNVNTFWNRYLVYHKGYNIKEYNDISVYEDRGEMAGEFFSDEQFLVQSVPKLQSYENPFCAMLVTISTHIPYRLDGITNLDEKLTIDVSHIEDEEFRNYLLSCNFTDYSFGKFLQELEESNLLENSILVVYGDHGAGLQNTEQIQKLFVENGQNYTKWLEKVEDTHVPFGIQWKGCQPSKIERAVSKIDVKPTILSLLGIKDTFSMGQSIFGQKDYAFIKGMGIVTKDYYYLDDSFVNRQSGLEETLENQETILQLKEQMKQEIYLSDEIIKKNLLQQKVELAENED